ncbi:MAG: hypothetical protein IT173_01610 [Acidobacteria bacterium]|nr:hypothetical protein [Acidobacteriota bacterium]
MQDQDKFDKVLEEVTFAWGQGNHSEGIALLDDVLLRVKNTMKGQCLLLRGMIKTDLGFHKDARKDWMAAIPYSSEGSFLRACLEYETGVSFENENRTNEALYYYRSAIDTCAYGNEFAGTKQLCAYLALNNGRILEGDEAMIMAAVTKSWRVLELFGEPNIAELPDAITKLGQGSSEKLRRIAES